MTTMEIGQKLVELCRSGRAHEALNTLFSPQVVSVEAMGSAAMPAVMNGIDAVKGKNQWWVENHEIHRAEAKGPFPNGDRFAVFFDYDVTAKAGPRAGQRMQLEEVALYTVEGGLITREEFFYSLG